MRSSRWFASERTKRYLARRVGPLRWVKVARLGRSGPCCNKSLARTPTQIIDYSALES